MKEVNDAFKNLGFKYNKNMIDKSYSDALKDDDFRKLISKLKISEDEIKKRTSLLEACVKELRNCSECPSIFECRNEIQGYFYSPMVTNDMIVFNYEACKYQKDLNEKNKYMNNIYLFSIPAYLKEAKMSEIYLEDSSRKEVVKWLKDFIKNYEKGKKDSDKLVVKLTSCISAKER